MVNIPPKVLSTHNGLELYETKWGKFYGFPNDLIIGKTVATDDIGWDMYVIDYAEKHVKPNSTVIDIGAHFGFHSVCLSRLAGRVLAIEPLCYKYLKLNIDENGCDNVTILPIAAYSKHTVMAIYNGQDKHIYIGDIDFKNDGNVGGYSLREAPITGDVVAYPLDLLVRKDEVVSYIKADAQGSDLQALLGLVETITRDKPAIVFEFEEHLAKFHGLCWMDYVRFLDEIKYTYTPIKGWENNFICLPG